MIAGSFRWLPRVSFTSERHDGNGGMSAKLRAALNRVVGRFWQTLGVVERETRESYSARGFSPSCPQCNASILRQSLKLIEPELVSQFLNQCADEANRQLKRLEAGVSLAGIVNPYSETYGQWLLQDVKTALEDLKSAYRGSSKDETRATAATVEAKAQSLKLVIAERFDTERREFEIQAKAQPSRQGAQKPDGTSVETALPERKAPEKKSTRDERNAEARRYLHKHRDREKQGKRGRVSARELTQHLKKVCGGGSTGGVSSLPAWKAVQEKRKKKDEEKRKVKSRSLTQRDMDNLPDRESELKRLVAEQDEDAKQDGLQRHRNRNR